MRVALRGLIVVAVAVVSACGPMPPAHPPAVTMSPPSAPVPRAQIIATQNSLRRLGYLSGPANGQFGPQTQSAIQRFQRRNRLAVTGDPSLDLLTHLTAPDAVAARSTPLAPPSGAGMTSSVRWVPPVEALSTTSATSDWVKPVVEQAP